MKITCKACGHTRSEGDAASPALDCPKCKMPYAWSETQLPAGYAAQNKPTPSERPANPPRATQKRSPPKTANHSDKERATQRPMAGLYVRGTLAPGEQLVYCGNIHWIVYLPGVIALAMAIALTPVIANTPSESAVAIAIAAPLLFLYGTLSLIRAFIVKRTTELALTTKRVVAKVGFIRRDTVDLNHTRVESYSVSQGVIGRLLDYGTVIVRGTGGATTPIRGVSAPLEFRRQAAALTDAQPT